MRLPTRRKPVTTAAMGVGDRRVERPEYEGLASLTRSSVAPLMRASSASI